MNKRNPIHLKKIGQRRDSLQSWQFKFKSYFSYFSERYKLKRLWNIFIILFFVWVLGANLIYLSEYFYHADGTPWENTSFQNYYHSYWDVIVYLTSGIEDYVPDSPYSKVFSFLLLISGITIVGVFTANLAAILITIFQQHNYIKQKPSHLNFSNHFVICGYTEMVPDIIDQLGYYITLQERPVVIVDPKADQILAQKEEYYKQVWGIAGDPSNDKILKKANVKQAFSVIVLGDSKGRESSTVSDASVILRSLKLSSLDSDIYSVAVLKDSKNQIHLTRARASEIIDISQYDKRLVAQSAMTHNISQFYMEMLEISPTSNEFYIIPIPAQWAGNSYCEIKDSIYNQTDWDITVVGYQVEEEIDAEKEIGLMASKVKVKHWRQIINPSSKAEKYNRDFVLTEKEKLIVIAYEMPDLRQIMLPA